MRWVAVAGEDPDQEVVYYKLVDSVVPCVCSRLKLGL